MTSIIHRLILMLLVISIGTGLVSAQSGTSELAYQPGAVTVIPSQINFQSSLSNRSRSMLSVIFGSRCTVAFLGLISWLGRWNAAP